MNNKDRRMGHSINKVNATGAKNTPAKGYSGTTESASEVIIMPVLISTEKMAYSKGGKSMYRNNKAVNNCIPNPVKLDVRLQLLNELLQSRSRQYFNISAVIFIK